MTTYTPKIVRSNRRTLTLQILPDRQVIVKAPQFISLGDITKFIDKNSDWIIQRLQALGDAKEPTKKHYVDGEEFLYLGRYYKLKVGNYKRSLKAEHSNEFSSFAYKEIMLKDEYLLFPNFLLFRAQKELTNWYKMQSKELIYQQLDFYAKQMGTEFKSVMFSDTRSKWGSCTHDNRLQFNWRLIFAPLLALNYVVVHELAHTIEKNHSRSFWSKVRLYNPSYKQQIKWFKQHGDKLFLEAI